MKPISLHLDYKSNKSELCEIGRKYDTDKSSQRDNATHDRHCHPYTLFYDSLFRNKKNDNLNIAELGILYGSSLLMWQEYFKNANIYGFDYNDYFIKNFKQNYNNERITLDYIDVTNKDSITNAFEKTNILYDIIIDDSTHRFEDQINIIENSYQYLKPGGIMIVEDIFKSYDEASYMNKLSQIIHHFQDFYFVTFDHHNRISTGWDNDKLLILVKNGAEPIFKNKNKLTIITPSIRVENIKALKESINFDYVHEWIIVYDETKIQENPRLFENEANGKIKEYIHKSYGISGNPQRNFALSKITNQDTFLYFLDDDNLIHPDLYRLLNIIDNKKMYTFDQYNGLKGNNIQIGKIDTAMLLIDYDLCKNIEWIIDLYEADGCFIENCYNISKDCYIYVGNELCYCNKLA